MDIGVLALQGSFLLHRPHLETLKDIHYREILTATDLDACDGLIIPGGESTSMLKLIQEQDMEGALRSFVTTKPTWGICAGAIVLAHRVTGPQQASFDAIDIDVARNGYGRQSESRFQKVDGTRVAFIRAPVIERVGEGTAVIRRAEGRPVWVEARNVLITTFHPELGPETPSPWHIRFINHFVVAPTWQ